MSKCQNEADASADMVKLDYYGPEPSLQQRLQAAERERDELRELVAELEDRTEAERVAHITAERDDAEQRAEAAEADKRHLQENLTRVQNHLSHMAEDKRRMETARDIGERIAAEYQGGGSTRLATLITRAIEQRNAAVTAASTGCTERE